MSESSTYLTVEEAMHYLSGFDTADAFRKWVKRHGVPRFRVGRTLRFLRRDLDEAVGNTKRQQRAFQSLPSKREQSHGSQDGIAVSGEAVGQVHVESVGDGERGAVVHSLDGAR